MRPTWDQYFLALAKTASTRAACSRSQVGAVLVDPTNRVRSVGYNGTPSGTTHCIDGGCPRGLHYPTTICEYDCDESECPCQDYRLPVCACGNDLPCIEPLSTYSSGPGRCTGFHAEDNALTAFGEGGLEWPQDFTMYITREPCNDCILLMLDDGIAKAVWPDGERIL